MLYCVTKVPFHLFFLRKEENKKKSREKNNFLNSIPLGCDSHWILNCFLFLGLKPLVCSMLHAIVRLQNVNVNLNIRQELGLFSLKNYLGDRNDLVHSRGFSIRK